MKEYGEFGEMEFRDLTSEPYTIKVKYHEGASRIGGDIHGVMCDLAASETVELKQGEVKVIPLGVSMKLPYGDFGIVVPRSSTCLKHGIMMANSIGIIEPDYCGDGDVWGFVAYAIRDTVIERGTRIAQFMPAPFVPDWSTIIFKEIESMGCADRGGYGSTGERSAEGQTAEGRTYAASAGTASANGSTRRSCSREGSRKNDRNRAEALPLLRERCEIVRTRPHWRTLARSYS